MLPKRMLFTRQSTQDAVFKMDAVGDDKTASASEQQISDDTGRAQLPSEYAQEGVKGVEAITLSWNKPSLVIVYLS